MFQSLLRISKIVSACYAVRLHIIFNIKHRTKMYCTLVSVEEIVIVKARQLVKEQELHAQETLDLCKSYLENTDNASRAKSQNSYGPTL